MTSPDVPVSSTFGADLVAALSELTNPPKGETATVPTKSGGSFSYDYAGLPAILDHVRPVLGRHGLALVQEAITELRDGAALVGVNTRLVHTSGEMLTAGPLLLPAGATPQTAGSALTYAARYAVCRLLGIAGADEDDDGSIASAQDRTSRPSPRASDPRMSDAPASDQAEGEGPRGASLRADRDQDPTPPPSPVEDGPTLPIGGEMTPDLWKKAAQRLTRAWKRNVTITDTKQAVLEELFRQDLGRMKASEVNEDLANHAIRELERRSG